MLLSFVVCKNGVGVDNSVQSWSRIYSDNDFCNFTHVESERNELIRIRLLEVVVGDIIVCSTLRFKVAIVFPDALQQTGIQLRWRRMKTRLETDWTTLPALRLILPTAVDSAPCVFYYGYFNNISFFIFCNLNISHN